MRLLLFILISVVLCGCQCLKVSRSRINLAMTNKEIPSNKVVGDLKQATKLLLPALLGSSFLLFNPLNADALSSGGRSGGSSFRSPSSTRVNSYSPRSSSSYSSRTYAPSRTVYVAPSIGYSPFMPSIFNPFGVYSLGFIPMNINVLLFGFTAFALYNFLQNRAGSSDFSGGNSESGVFGQTATVTKLQIAVSADWKDQDNIMQKLATIASKYGSIDGRGELASLLSEVSLALLRKKSDWHSVSYDGNVVNDINRAESTFQRLAIQERSKFEIESSSNSQYGLIQDSNRSKPTLSVVTLIIASRGKSSSFSDKPLRTFEATKSCLEGLAADALTNEGENILGVELLWSPDNSQITLSERDLVQDYPELLKL